MFTVTCTFIIVNYTSGSLNDVMKRIEKSLSAVFTSTKCKKLSDIKESALMKPDVYKKDLAGVL